MITQAQLTDNLAGAEAVLLKEPDNAQVRQFLWQAYWGLADMYYNRGDFDGHVALLNSVVDVSDRVAQQTGLSEYPTRFISWEGTCGLGHLAQGLDMHVKARQLGLIPNTPTVILAHPDVVANKHYLGYWAKHFDAVIDNPAAIETLKPLGGARDYFGALETHYVATRLNDRRLAYCEAAWEIQKEWDAQGNPFLLQLTADDMVRGCDALKQAGMPPGSWFAVLHVRESNNWDHATGRNVALSDYFPAIAAIVERGGWVVRVGNPSMTPLPRLPHVLDYAHLPGRSDWMDTFLLGAAKFALCTQSGPAEVTASFGVPTLLTNWQFGFRHGYRTDVSIFKRYRVNGRVMPMEQALAQRFAFIETPGMFVPGVEVLSNTPEEIKELVEEWLDAAPASDADKARALELDTIQARVMTGHKHTPNGYCRVGRKWLEKVMAGE